MCTLSTLTMDLDFSFLHEVKNEPPQNSATFPSDSSIASATTTLKILVQQDVFSLYELQCNADLTAFKVLQSSPAFDDSAIGKVLVSLPAFLSNILDSANKCLDFSTKIAVFNYSKNVWDNLSAKKNDDFSKLIEIGQQFDTEEEFIAKIREELATHESKRLTLLEEGESLKARVVAPDEEIHAKENQLVGQKDAYQTWTKVLADVENTRAYCVVKWKDIG